MGFPRPNPIFTVDEYLTLERAAEERHEYLDGQIHAMAGESDVHADISANLVGLLHAQLRGTPCRARTKDTKVRSGPAPKGLQTKKGLYSYPDIVVICGEPEYHDAHEDVVLNPKVIIEVLSEATEAFDRGEKCMRYQTWNPTLSDYLLVSQDQPLIEHHFLQTDRTWAYRRFVGLETACKLTSIGCSLPLRDVYERVTFA